MVGALQFLHDTCGLIHRNVCPTNVYVTKKGTWKLGGLELVTKMVGVDPQCEVACPAWTAKVPKIVQPDLNFMGNNEMVKLLLMKVFKLLL